MSHFGSHRTLSQALPRTSLLPHYNTHTHTLSLSLSLSLSLTHFLFSLRFLAQCHISASRHTSRPHVTHLGHMSHILASHSPFGFYFYFCFSTSALTFLHSVTSRLHVRHLGFALHTLLRIFALPQAFNY